MAIPVRNVWILGGTGFIGGALVKYLSADKSNRLHLVLHKTTFPGKFEEMNTFFTSLADIDPFWFDRYPPDVVFHLARPAGSNSLTRHIRSRYGEKANRRLAGILAGLRNPPVIVYVSGSLVYGNHSAENPALEDSDPGPVSFAKFYLRNELPWIDAQQEGLLDVRIARPGWIVGPASWFFIYFWQPYLHTGRVPCYGDGSQLMPVIHIDDCAAMIDTISRYGQKGGNLNIYSGEAIRQRDFCIILSELLNTVPEFIPYGAVRRKYGKTTAEALMSSTSMKTLYPELHLKAEPRYGRVADILADVIADMKNS
jgi:nucleoside-diphosphate-sugar epimerase